MNPQPADQRVNPRVVGGAHGNGAGALVVRVDVVAVDHATAGAREVA